MKFKQTYWWARYGLQHEQYPVSLVGHQLSQWLVDQIYDAEKLPASLEGWKGKANFILSNWYEDLVDELSETEGEHEGEEFLETSSSLDKEPRPNQEKKETRTQEWTEPDQTGQTKVIKNMNWQCKPVTPQRGFLL
jgi:hypothetical protein